MIPNSIKASVKDIDVLLKKIEVESGCRLHITSGKRSKEHNRRVGGAPNSYHLSDRARDFRSADRKRGCGIKKLGRIACKYASTIVYKWHVHIDNREGKKLCTTGTYKKK